MSNPRPVYARYVCRVLESDFGEIRMIVTHVESGGRFDVFHSLLSVREEDQHKIKLGSILYLTLHQCEAYEPRKRLLADLMTLEPPDWWTPELAKRIGDV